MTALVLGILAALTIAAILTTDERERAEQLLYGSAVTRHHAERIHPSNHTEFDAAEVHDLCCERCGAVVYRVATCGYDLLVVLQAERQQFDLAVDWHRDFECQRVSA